MVLPSERFAADVAGVGPLVGVRPLVDQQIVALGELSVAKFADELLFGPGRATRSSQQSTVRVDVHLGRTRRKEGATAGEREGGGARRVGQEGRIRVGLVATRRF